MPRDYRLVNGMYVPSDDDHSFGSSFQRPALTPSQWSAHVGSTPPAEYKGNVPPKQFWATGIPYYDPESGLALELMSDVNNYIWYDYTPPAPPPTADEDKDKKE